MKQLPLSITQDITPDMISTISQHLLPLLADVLSLVELRFAAHFVRCKILLDVLYFPSDCWSSRVKEKCL